MPITGATVFSPEGTPDDPGHVAAVLDGNPTTVWRTDQYFQQFPALKKGVGIMTTLGSPSKLTRVTISSPTPGTVVEIRTSPTASPTLDQTQMIGQVTLGNGNRDPGEHGPARGLRAHLDHRPGPVGRSVPVGDRRYPLSGGALIGVTADVMRARRARRVTPSGCLCFEPADMILSAL